MPQQQRHNKSSKRPNTPKTSPIGRNDDANAVGRRRPRRSPPPQQQVPLTTPTSTEATSSPSTTSATNATAGGARNHHKAITTTTLSTISLLERLSHACQNHAAHHYNNNNNNNNTEDGPSSSSFVAASSPHDQLDDLPPRCRKDLISLATILPKVELATKHQLQQQQTSSSMSSSTTAMTTAAAAAAVDVGHLCSFYQDVLIGGYCPHAPHLFVWGKNGGKEVLPRVYNLFQHLTSRAILQNAVAVLSMTTTKTTIIPSVATTTSAVASTATTTTVPVIEPVSTIICRTIAQLLNFLPDEEPISRFIALDLINFCFDLSVIAQVVAASTEHSIFSSSSSPQQPLQVEILSQTWQASRSCYCQLQDQQQQQQQDEECLLLLDIPSIEVLLLLQASVFSILLEFLHLCQTKRLEESIITIRTTTTILQAHDDDRDGMAQQQQQQQQYPTLENVDALFYRVLLGHDEALTTDLLASIRQVLIMTTSWNDDSDHHDNSNMHAGITRNIRSSQMHLLLAQQARIAAGRTLLAFLQDCEQHQDAAPTLLQQQHGGLPTLPSPIVMQVRWLVVQAVEAWYNAMASGNRNNKVVQNNDPEYRSILAQLLCHSILRPILHHQRFEDEHILVCTMLDCIPLWKQTKNTSISNCGSDDSVSLSLELVILRCIHAIGSSRNGCDGHGNGANSILIDVVWSHCASRGLWDHVFALLHSSNKSIVNVTLWIIEWLLSSHGTIADKMERCCATAYQQFLATGSTTTPAPTTTNVASPTVVRVQDVTNQPDQSPAAGVVKSPTRRKRRRMGIITHEEIHPQPLTLQSTPPRQTQHDSNNSVHEAINDNEIKSRTSNEEAAVGCTTDSVSAQTSHCTSYSLNDSLANFLFIALKAAAGLLKIVQEQGSEQRKLPVPASTPHNDLRSRLKDWSEQLTTVSSAIRLLINALARHQMKAKNETAAQNCGSLLDVIVALCNPMKEVCRSLLENRNVVIDNWLLPVFAEAISSVGLQANFVLDNVIEGTNCDARLDLLRATWEAFSCLAFRFWVAAPQNHCEAEKETTKRVLHDRQSPLPAFCCRGVCTLLRSRVAVGDFSKQFLKDDASSHWIDADCFCCFLPPSTLEPDPPRSQRFSLSCSLMLLQGLPLRSRCGVLTCLRPPHQQSLLLRSALSDFEYLLPAQKISNFVLDLVHGFLLNAGSETASSTEATSQAILNVSSFLLISLASQQIDPTGVDVVTRTKELLVSHIELALLPTIRAFRYGKTIAMNQESIYWHIRCVYDLIMAISSHKFSGQVTKILHDPARFITYVTRNTFELRLNVRRWEQAGPINSTLTRPCASLLVAVVTLAIQRPDKDVGRLLAFAIVTMEGDLRAALKQSLGSLADEQQVPVAEDFEGNKEASSILWMVRLPFNERDIAYRMAAARDYGTVLTANNFNFLYTMFATDEEWSILGRPCVDDDFTEEESKVRKQRNALSEKIVRRLFQEIDKMLDEQSSAYRSIFLVASEDNSAGLRDEASSHRLAAVVALSSICQSLNSTSPGSIHIVEQALLRLVRVWMHSESPEYDSGDRSLSALAFLEMSRLRTAWSPSTIFPSWFSDNFIPAVFSDILLPSREYERAHATAEAQFRLRRCRLLKTFLESFVVPVDCEETTTAFQSVVQVVADWQPTVLAHFITTQDYERLCLTTLFNLFLLREERRLAKHGLTHTKMISEQISCNPLTKISARELQEQSTSLCLGSGVIEKILPVLLSHSDRTVLVFFTRTVLKDKISLNQIIEQRETLVLKELVWQVGRDPDLVNRAIRTLTTAAIERGQEGSEHRDHEAYATIQWITSHFMHLLVSVVQCKWETRKNSERLQAIRCLRELLGFLEPSESPQYFPLVMATINTATTVGSHDNGDSVFVIRIRLVAVQALVRFVKLVVEHQWEAVGTNLTAIVVALNPVFLESTASSREEQWCQRETKRLAVGLLELLSRGEVGEMLSSFFRDIPFLIMFQELDNVRSALRAHGVDFDGLFPKGNSEAEAGNVRRLDSASMESESGNSEALMLQGRLNMLQSLLTNENIGIRRTALQHLTDIVRQNRDVFYGLVENESRMSVLRYLTEKYVISDPQRVDGAERGIVTEIVETLLSRCVDEDDEQARILIATCLGEIGAIGEHHLGDIDMASALGIDRRRTRRSASSLDCRATEKRISNIEFETPENLATWRLSQPPWQSIAERYELQLLTKHMVVALKTAPTTVDQHKIAFTIQQLLVLLDNSARGSGNQLGSKGSVGELSNETSAQATRKMSQWLIEKLAEADVLGVIEPYWSSKFNETEAFVPKQPPFFPSAANFFTWLSNWCRYMVRRSKDRGSRSRWSDFFFACRTALRTQAGVSSAEFLLPLLILESLCFGDAEDERVVLQEMSDVLIRREMNAMNKTDHQRAVHVVFMVLDTLSYWSVHETEARYQTSRETPRALKLAEKTSLSSWSAETSVLRIEDVVKAIPLSIQARAASDFGMHARALRLLEMQARLSVVDRVFNAANDDDLDSVQTNSAVLSSDDRVLMKDVLVNLNDSDSLVVVASDVLGADASERARDSIRKKEATSDWLGALLEYERAQQLDGPDRRDWKLQKGALRCLMKLGQFESVLNQVTNVTRSTKGRSESAAPAMHLIPLAIEASWRLGRWSALSELVEAHSLGCSNGEENEILFQASFGEAMLGFHTRSFETICNAVKNARDATMKALASAAKESYDRSYAHIVKLHCLREIENAAEVLCKPSISTSSKLSSVAESKSHDGWDWERRISLLSNNGSTEVMNTRLALARFAGDEELEGSLFLSLGKIARRSGLSSMAANSFAQAEAIFDRLDRRSYLSCVRMQLAKLTYESGEITAAMKLLGQGEKISPIGFDASAPNSAASVRENSLSGLTTASTDARCMLKSTCWMIEGGLKGSGEIMRRFRVIQKLSPDWEKGHFQFAKYMDSVMQSRVNALIARYSQHFSSGIDEDAQRGVVVFRDQTCHQYVLLSMQHYAKALVLDSKHVYLALPRLLSIWFDFTGIQASEVEMVVQANDKTTKTADLVDFMRQRQSEANSFMATHHKIIPAHLFYTVIPQLVSCLVHANEDTSLVVQRTLKRVLTKFPATAMWPLAWLRQSRNTERLRIGEELFLGAQKNLAIAKNTRMEKLLGASKSLFKYLLDLAKYSPTQQQGNSFPLTPWKGEVELSEFIPPLQAALSICINRGKDGHSRDFFSRRLPRMRCFASQVQCMASKARPKKLKAYAVPGGNSRSSRTNVTSGRESNPRSRPGDIGEIHFLLKQEAKGDLRKDARVQDLNNVINRLMAAGISNTRQRRRLHLRTFAVTCLSEDTGIIEWCPNTSSLRSLVAVAYNPQASPYSNRRRGRRAANLADASLRNNFEERCQGLFFKNGKLAQAAALFEELCLRPYPPVLYWWFVENFQDPHAWYEARNRFALTAAAWSVVGHVAIALGDRHAENILVDTTSGDCVHVDFDCIFDKGISLPKPEVVPFRLTQNMVDAFGPTGADGVYSGGLRTALTTLRNNRDTLLSVLEPFVKDPVIDWKRSRRTSSGVDNSFTSRDSSQAKRSIKVIDERLRGIYNLRNPNLRKIRRTDGVDDDQDDETSHFLPLSVEGQVHKMIAEATSSENLVQLYVGWMPWI